MSAEAASPAELLDPVEHGHDSVPLQLGGEEREQLAQVIQLHPDVIFFTEQAYHYAPVENAELQAQDNMRLRLLGSVAAIQEYRESRAQAIADGKKGVERLPYGPDVIKQNEQLAAATNDRFWFAYYGTMFARRHARQSLLLSL